MGKKIWFHFGIFLPEAVTSWSCSGCQATTELSTLQLFCGLSVTVLLKIYEINKKTKKKKINLSIITLIS